MPAIQSFISFAAGASIFIAIALALKVLVLRYRRRFDQDMSRQLRQVQLFVDPSRLLRANAVLLVFLVMLIIWLTSNPWLALVVAFAQAGLPKLVVQRLRSRRRDRLRAQMPEIAALLATNLRAGTALPVALGEISRQMPSPGGQEIALLVREHRMGSSLDAAMVRLGQRADSEDVSLVVATLRLGQRQGASMAAVLESLAAAMRRRLVLEKKVHAMTAQARMQAWLMAALPFIVLAGSVLVDPTLWSVYFESASGWILIGTVVLLQLVGAWVISRMVRVQI